MLRHPMIHPTAIVDPAAKIDPTAFIGPYVVIEGPADIRAGCRVEAHAQILGHVELGEGTTIGRAALIGGDPQDLGFKAETESSVIIGPRNIIREHVTIHRGSTPGGATRVGEGNFIMTAAHLAHDVVLGNHNILANACLLAGHVQVGNYTFIGGGSAFHQFIRIGDYCVVQGNGSLGMDLPHYCAAHGSNQIVGLNIVGLRRQGFTAEQRAEIKEMFKELFHSGMNLSQAIASATQRQWESAAQQMLDFVMAPSKRGICPVRRGAAND
jgi:UDP-N-acetylglucosamine acyltransferase